MQMRMSCGVFRGAVLAAAMGMGTLAHAQTSPATFTDGQQIEAREGDTWSPATVVKREGRRYQIRYEDGTEEWVTGDRLRAPGAAGEPAPATPAGQAEPQIGQKVKAKWGMTWWDATIKKKIGSRWEVLYSDNTTGLVTRDEILLPGEVDDTAADRRTGRPNPAERRQPSRPDRPTSPEPSKPEASPFAQRDLGQPVTEADLSAVQEILPAAGEWSPAVDAAAPLRISDRPIAIKGKKGEVFDKASLQINGTRALHILSVGGPGSKDGPHYATPVDLASGSNGITIQLPHETLPLGLSGDGRMLIGRANGFFGGTSKRVDLWTSTAAQPKHLLSFEPYADESSGRDQDVDKAEFVGPNLVLTSSKEGTLILWQVKTDAPVAAKAVWRLKPEKGQAGAMLSPGRKYVFAPMADGVLVLNLTDGQPRGFLASDGAVASLSVSPDGKQLVGVGGWKVWVWDLQTGELKRELPLPAGVAGKLVSLDPQFVLIGDSLFDLAKGNVAWVYTHASSQQDVNGRLIFASDLKDRPAVRPIALPHPAAREAAAKLPPPTFAVKEGATVSLDISLEGGDADRGAIMDALKQQLAAAKINVSDGQPVRLVARVETGKSEQRTYRRFGAGFGAEETVTVTPKYTKLSWMKGDTTLWVTQSGSGAGFHLQLKEGQSTQDAVNEATKPNVAWLKTVKLPTLVIDTTATPPPGQSTLSLNGVAQR